MTVERTVSGCRENVLLRLKKKNIYRTKNKQINNCVPSGTLVAKMFHHFKMSLMHIMLKEELNAKWERSTKALIF